VVNLDAYSALMSVSGAAAATRVRVIAGQKLRETVRHGTPLAHVGEADFLIADVFTTRDPSVLIERIRSAPATAPSRLRASIGTVNTPLRPLVSRPPHAVVDELLTVATTAMHEARRAGGDQHRLIVDPPLTLLDESESDPDERPAEGNVSRRRGAGSVLRVCQCMSPSAGRLELSVSSGLYALGPTERRP
jgi:hypothetical protein